MKSFLKRFILLMVMAVVAGITFAFVFDMLQVKEGDVEVVTPVVSEPVVTQKTDMTEDESTVVDIVNRLKYAIVSVNTSGRIQNEQQLLGTGSGVAFKMDDNFVYIMTNHHVVAGGNDFTIGLVDGGEVSAELIASDSDTEIAVLKVKRSAISGQLDLAALGKSSQLVVGENVLAIGNALGYGQSVTRGIVSAIDREVEGYRGGYAYKMIQTDAAINPGNSGGALVNMRGEVVGINTLKIADSRVEGVGFAIPVESANEISLKLMELGYLPKTFIGVASRYIDPMTLKDYSLPMGTLVYSVVNGSPAQLAGIQREDIILKVNDTPTPDPETLGFVIRSHKPGEVVTVTVYRAGKTMDLTVTLAETNK